MNYSTYDNDSIDNFAKAPYDSNPNPSPM
jgi:hypothetical protein